MCNNFRRDYITVVGTINFGATTVYADITSISLSAGDWDVSVIADLNANGAVIALIGVGIGTASGNNGAGFTFGNSATRVNASYVSYQTFMVPPYRVSLASPATIYLKSYANYSGTGPPQTTTARLSARRVR